MAKGDGFESKLVYEWALPNVLLRARNELRDDAGSVLGQYEGHYMWDVERSSLVFWTVGRDGEMHSGTATWRDGHLWHDANVSGGRITGYRSVLGLVDGELRYQAIYQRSVTDSAVLASRPLIYRREKTGAQEGAIHGSLPGWFLHALEGLTRNGGRWEADNSDYEAETEPFPSYGLEYIIGSSGRTARGRLFGIRTDWQEQDFWEFLLYWDPLAGEAITMQTHVSVFFGVGGLREAEPGLEELQQRLWWGREQATGSLHRVRMSQSQSFDYETGRWAPRRRYVRGEWAKRHRPQVRHHKAMHVPVRCAARR